MLSDLQDRVARIFATLPEAADFALAGASALILRGEVDRTTRDLDFFATSADAVDRVLPAVEQALVENGLKTERVQVSKGFARVRVSSATDECLVDLAYDFRLFPPEPSPLGPTVARDELAADKVLALFGRALARDFIDVFYLARKHGRDRLIDLACLKDRGFSKSVFAEMLGSLSRFDRAEFELEDATLESLRSFFSDWREELDSGRREGL